MSFRIPSTGFPSVEVTSFVGRRSDLLAIQQLFSISRLVTLTGVGGVGKSRLALRAAQRMRRAFPDGVFFVEISSLRDEKLIPQTLVEALGIREQRKRDILEILIDHVRVKHMLLVIDNAEHLASAVSALVTNLLTTSPHLRILVSSRHALSARGEHIYPVRPLVVPEFGSIREPPSTGEYSAVTLFADRARAVLPDFAITPENEEAVIRICQRLDGIPLAIELAAVRLRVLSVNELAERLDDRFQLLRGSEPGSPDHHQSLQTLIDWSYGLCCSSEQYLWARASVFSGGFSIRALEEVCSDTQLPKESVLDTVSGLVEKSIFVLEEHGSRVRFRMLETIREYGQKKLLKMGDSADLALRHRDWYAEILESVARDWIGPYQVEIAAELQLEFSNIRQAMDYSMSRPGESRVALKMASGLFFWGALEFFAEASLWLDRGLEIEEEPTSVRVQGLATSAYFSIFQHDFETVARRLKEALELATELGDAEGLAYVKHVIGLYYSFSKEFDKAVLYLTEAEQGYMELGDPMKYIDSLRVELAQMWIILGDLDKAEEIIESLYSRMEDIGELWNFSYALWLRGLVSIRRKEFDKAIQSLREAIKIKREFKDSLGTALTLEALARATVYHGESARGAQILGAADRVWQTLGVRQMLGSRETAISQACSDLGDVEFESQWRHGYMFDLTGVFALVLDEPLDEDVEEAPDLLDALTRREREVAELVAQGMSNKEIAAHLVISLRTAEGHVENILSKLGFQNRTQVASMMPR